MWILMNDSMLSVVAHNDRPDDLLVRARLSGDIESVFSQAQVEERSDSDYRFRAVLPRPVVADVLSRRLQAIDYGNFKNSVRDLERHDAYMDVWSRLRRMQRQAR